MDAEIDSPPAHHRIAKIESFIETPAQLGYTFPTSGTPSPPPGSVGLAPKAFSFPDKYHTVPENLARIIREITPREQVHINVPNGNYGRIVKQQLKEHGCPLRNIHFHHIKTNESWCRDHGPAFVAQKRKETGTQLVSIANPPSPLLIGASTPGAENIRRTTTTTPSPRKSRKNTSCRSFYPHIVMEGGSVEFNGAGTIMTTASCLLNKNRNPHLTKSQIEQYLKDYYGQSHVIWLGEGIAGDDTDGHIDDLTRFINPTTIVTTLEDDPKDENYQVLKDNRKRLDKLRDQNGDKFTIIDLPMPGVVEHAGQRLPATYANFYFINGALLVPTYRHKKNDKKALNILQRALPNHKVIGIDCTELIWGLGAIHCLTQQQPRV